MDHKSQENWVRLIYCLQDPTIHRKDLHINVLVQLCIPDHVYYNEIHLNYLIKIKKFDIFNGKYYNCSDIFNVLKEQQNPLSVGLTSNKSLQSCLKPNQ